MKSAVIFKWSFDPVDAKLSSANVVEWGNAKFSPSDDDPAAIAVARSISSEEDIVGVTVGSGKPDWAAARGAATTLKVNDEPDSVDGSATAEVLAKAVERIGDVDAVIIGDSDWKYSVVSALAGKLGWLALANVVDCAVAGDHLEVTCKDARGSRVISAQPPVLLAAKALEKETNPPGMKQMLAARKKPVEEVSASDLGVTDAAGAAELRETVLPEQTGAQMFEGSAEEASEALVKALRADGLL